MPSNTEYAELIERLRAVESSGSCIQTGVTTCWYRNPDGPEAATALERLSSDREILREARDAIASLSEDALGYGQPAFAHDADLHRWPLRDELLSRINTALGDKE